MTENKREGNAARPVMSRAIFKQMAIETPKLRSQITFWSLALAGLELDLWTKSAVFAWLDQKDSFSVIDGYLQFVTALNNGAAFGIFAGKMYMLMAVSVIALIVILAVFYLGGNQHVMVNMALGLLVAGICAGLSQGRAPRRSLRVSSC